MSAAPHRVLVGHHLGRAHPEAGRHHVERICRGRPLQLLHVRREDDAGRRASGHGCADRRVQQAGQLLGHRHHVHVVVRDILEQRDQVDLLLVVAAHRAAGRLTDDRHHGHVVELGVVQPVAQVDGARAGRRRAHPDAAGELRVAHRLERRHLLVPGLREAGLVVRAAERRNDSVDAVARIAEDALDPPLHEADEQLVGDGVRHVNNPPLRAAEAATAPPPALWSRTATTGRKRRVPSGIVPLDQGQLRRQRIVPVTRRRGVWGVSWGGIPCR